MGLFHKKEKKEDTNIPELPRLPELPNDYPRPIYQLPSFPNNSLGDKFSQNTIKEAIAGREEGDFEEIVDDFDSIEEPQKIQIPQIKMSIKPQKTPLKISREIVREAEPLFVRLDKFKESHEILDNVKKQMHEITHLLNETNSIKEKEDEQLRMWGTELQEIKNKIEKINSDLFSKI